MKSWISIGSLTLLLAGFYPAFVFVSSKCLFQKQEARFLAEWNLDEALNNPRYFQSVEKEEGFQIALQEALLQAPRIAKLRDVPLETVENLILAHIQFPTSTLLGRKQVSLFELNLALDRL